MSAGLMFTLPDEDATLALGAAVGTAARSGGVVFLCGDLGAGKTTFSRGLLRGLGFPGSVKSPTYTLVEPYQLPGLTVYHFDLYRLHDPQELEYMGIRDYFDGRSLCLVEWPERGVPALPNPDIVVDFQTLGSGRQVAVASRSAQGDEIVRNLGMQNISNISRL